MSKPGYVAPKLSFERVAEQLKGIAELAGNLLESGSIQIVAEACDDLLAMKDSRTKMRGRWEIDRLRPIATRAGGDYQTDGKGGLLAQAAISFVWEIAKVERCRDAFMIEGLCSTEVTIRDTSKRLGGVVSTPICWTFEMGDINSPGCHFHAQINWKSALRDLAGEDDMCGWPSLDVPRLPTFLLTPGDCLDFVLGEMFQDEWPRRYESAGMDRIGRWVGDARARTTQILEMCLKAATDGRFTSPWLAIKQWYPTDAPRSARG
jgi:hypothetical protein